jgi:hypothetical protein
MPHPTKKDRTCVHWNDPAILLAAGNAPEPIKRLLAQYEQPVPSDLAIYQWISRRRITHVWRAPLLFALLADGKIKTDKLFRLGSAARADAP